jgi:hypothetical protein
LTERLKQKLRRADSVNLDALRLKQELHCFEDGRLIVGD